MVKDNLAYLKELIARYEKLLKEVEKAETPADVTKQERLAHPLLKEMQMAVPRVWTDFTIATRDRRLEIRDSI